MTKLEAAQRQLTTAIRMFFADGDPVAVHTLACAAREIYEKHCRKAKQGRMFDFLQAGNPGQKKSFGICSTQRETSSSTRAIHWISQSSSMTR